MDVDKQICVIWSATNGYTDDVAVGDLRKFESGLLSFFENSKGGLLEEIREKKAFDKDVTQKMHDAVKEFKERFLAQAKGAIA
jgi:F-type H+-transporting ATPase subunit alpha